MEWKRIVAEMVQTFFGYQRPAEGVHFDHKRHYGTEGCRRSVEAVI